MKRSSGRRVTNYTRVKIKQRSVKSINDRRRVIMVGHLTDLINMADCQEWNGQRFKKKTCKKT